MIQNQWLALLASFVLAVLWVRFNEFLAHRGFVSTPLSRKLIHIGTGPIFVLTGLLFPNTDLAPWLAATIPLLITGQFFLVGAGIIKDQAAVDSMSRSGRREEILRGPLIYGIVFVVLTVLFWYRTETGIVALMMLCGGDGLADVVGKRVKSKALPWSPGKTVSGSLAMFAGGWLFSVLVLAIFYATGKLDGSLLQSILPVTIIAAVSTVVESLPVPDFDNLTVPLTAVALGLLFF